MLINQFYELIERGKQWIYSGILRQEIRRYMAVHMNSFLYDRHRLTYEKDRIIEKQNKIIYDKDRMIESLMNELKKYKLNEKQNLHICDGVV